MRAIISSTSFQLKTSFLRNIRYQISTKEQFLHAFSEKKFYELLGLSHQNHNEISDTEIHKAYLNQIRKYHSDGVYSEHLKVQYDQITKCLTRAFDILRKQRERTGIFKQNMAQSEDEDQISKRLFGKRFIEIQQILYSEGNQEMKRRFLEELQKKRKTNNESPSQKKENPKQNNNSEYNSGVDSTHSSTNNSSLGIGIAVLVGIVGVSMLFGSKSQEKSQTSARKEYVVAEITEKQIKSMEAKTIELQDQKTEKFINSVLKQRPPILQYPSDYDLPIMDQLIQYSIAPDIHLYEVSPDYFLDFKKNQELKDKNQATFLSKFPLTQTKPNTLMNLSLEAERCLQNIYVKVDDLVQEIQNHGSFTPPKIFFRFFGYIMFEIRQKPFSLQNYRNTEYVSLFDLYFNYYSPIFFKRDYYYNYVVGLNKEDPSKDHRYFGYVTLNYRPLPSVYLKKDEKIVIMRDVEDSWTKNNTIMKRNQTIYLQTWKDYYTLYQTRWKSYGKGKFNAQ